MIGFAKNILRKLYVEYSMPISVYSNKQSKDKVLICYIKSPFYMKDRPVKHCNVIESQIIAETFYNLGYSVDVVDCRCKRKIDYSKYKVICGFGLSFRNSFFNARLSTKRICYLTGANPNFSNTQEALRIKTIFKSKGTLLLPRREVYWPWMHAAINSDHLIVTGNQFTENSYKNLNNNISHVSVPFIKSSLDIQFNAQSNTGFLWFGGAGALFKGLDLAIDSVKESVHNIKLDICGPISGEKDFFDLYDQDISKNQYINFHGMIDVSSSKMKLLAERNAFVILPSCSEGGASSVLTCMNLGMIPIVTKECSINLVNFGIQIKDFTLEAMREAINTAIAMTDQEINLQRGLIRKFLDNNHSENAIKMQMTDLLKKILSK